MKSEKGAKLKVLRVLEPFCREHGQVRDSSQSVGN